MIGLRSIRNVIWVGTVTVPAFLYASADTAEPDMLGRMKASDIVFLGEQHDNPHHHDVQAHYVRSLSPAVLVFEMLTVEQASRATPELLEDMDALEAAFGWEEAGWPDFSMYYPIFEAAPEAIILGAGVPRDQLRDIFGHSLADAVDPALASRFGLGDPLPEAQQAAREALQRESHCNALPEDLLAGMVDIQRLRDAKLAEAALDGLEQTGGPVVVITGNGHARPDWGAPFLVQYAAPDVSVFALGQGEDGSVPQGDFVHTSDAPSVDRGDPCDAFR